ncbi:LysR substrate-binding domain-containing protein [Phenylobacterium sp.]|jgi:LysR family glycine cleavage system transcriptional activator|uniref:LysR substrate-binding domain-containing protein n=1 Tax=Phenylobacterium sp. TaxID=1871053 RepID=UPI002E36914D|nr:LysR substrate-binding domain-containing protein [Phenylobacterium sp.]HEX3365839.1 LysR substrate-binding domain-containing protein [Phenylobacterium sp.]
MKRLPPYFALRALEAAARHQSYSRAAKELAVTHGAVSQQIRRLEAELGARLFRRQGNGMIPLPAAARLAERIAAAQAILSDAVQEFASSASADALVVSIDPQLGVRWLPRRLTRLLADPAGANLDLRFEERLADFVSDGVDVGLRYGREQPIGVESALLFREQLFPVCSPTLAGHEAICTPQDLLAAPLLRHTHRPWRLWFSGFGLSEPPASGPVFEDSMMVIEAAAQGMGVALARSSLVQHDLETGRLVRLLPEAVENDFAFYVAWRGDNPKLARIHALRDWLVAEIGREPGAGEPDSF